MTRPPHLIVCVGNEGAEDLQILKVYRRLPDPDAEAEGYLCVIDESGEDYLYPESYFVFLPLPLPLEKRLETLAAEKRSRIEMV